MPRSTTAFNLFRYVGARHLMMKPGRTLLTVFGVMLGISLYVAISIINRSTLASFRESIDAVAGKATLVASAGEAGFREEALKKVTSVPGVKYGVPMIEARAYFAGARSTETLVVLGVDLLKEQSVRTYKTSNEQMMDDPLVFMNQADSIIVTHVFAKEHGLKIDSPLELATAQGSKRFMVRGLLSPEGPAKAYGGAIAVMDIDGAQLTFGKQGKYDRIDIVTREGADIAKTAEELRTALGSGFTVERPESQSENMERMVKAFQEITLFFGVLALIVGLFLISNAITVSVAERRQEIGTLRALGATRRHILGLFLSDAVFMGLIGSLLGGLLGRVLASLMLDRVSRSLSISHFTRVSVSHLDFGAPDIVRALAIGTTSCALAALWPSVRATLVHPLETMRRTDITPEGKSTGLFRYSPWIGLAMLCYLAIATRAGWATESATLTKLEQTCGLLGSALIGPWIVGKLIGLSRDVLQRLAIGGIVARLAQGNIMRNPRRTGVNVTTLMVGLMLVITISAVNHSFRSTVQDFFNKMLTADILISSNGRIADVQVQPLDESLGPELSHIPELLPAKPHTVSAMRLIHLRYEGVDISLKAYDEGDPQVPHWTLETLDRPRAQAKRELYHSTRPAMMVSENFVVHFRKKTGDYVSVPTPSGVVDFRIVGIVTDFSSNNGVLVMSRGTYKKFWNDPLVSVFAAKVRPGIDAAKARLAIDRAIGHKKNLIVTSSADFKKQLLEIIDQSFSYTHAIEAAALVIALLGLLNTLLVSVLERMREFGTLRAVGMSRPQVAGLIIQESVIQGGFGAVAAVAFGALIGWLWTTSTLARVMGWVIHFYFPWGAVGITLLTGTVVAFIAGIYPAYRAASLNIQEALSYE